jgi:hypothetical protein
MYPAATPPVDGPPTVSVLMPTFRQASFLPRALESLAAQTYQDWEAVVVDDGSPDETSEIVTQAAAADPRIRLVRLDRNEGLGHALNVATAHARGALLAYLPSDDVFYADHLTLAVKLLTDQPEIYLAYGGVRWGHNPLNQEWLGHWGEGATLQGDDPVGREAEALENPPVVTGFSFLKNGNLLALAQVVHRRDLEAECPWPTRAEIVSDTIELDQWRALTRRGARMRYTGSVTTEWVQHPDQRHRIIGAQYYGNDREHGGLSRYRSFYGLQRGTFVNWVPARGLHLDERRRFGRFDRSAAPEPEPAPDGLRILMVGSLGFNPDRIMAFEERGHRLAGTWVGRPEPWDTTGPLPFGNVEEIPFGPDWERAVDAWAPDVIYALLNWQAVPLIREVLGRCPDRPFVFHFKEGPGFCQEYGLWEPLLDVLRHSDGVVFLSEENREWFRQATGGAVEDERSLLLDGDLPKADWMTDEWAPKLSAQDGAIHTVCAARWLSSLSFADIAAQGIHVHLYGRHRNSVVRKQIANGLETGYVHLHDTVYPDEWVRELSQYDAAWTRIAQSDNGGELRRAHWDDLNLPARLGTYAAAGLPWIIRRSPGSLVAVDALAERHGFALGFDDLSDLGEQLRDQKLLATTTAAARAARAEFAFDTHVDRLVELFVRAIKGRGAYRAGRQRLRATPVPERLLL